MTFNVLKSSYFQRCSVNLSPSKCKEKSQHSIFLHFGIVMASVFLRSFQEELMSPSGYLGN